jgi:dicarboxylate transporter 10
MSPPVKVRLQAQHHHGALDMADTFKHVYQGEGVTGLYRGISASLLRQLSYSTARFATYEKLKYMAEEDGRKAPHSQLVGLAAVSGLVGGIVGNPADILNVRMQNDAALLPADRRNYGNAIRGYMTIVREEGWKQSIFRGMVPNLGRGVLMTAGQLAGYDVFKMEILAQSNMKDSTVTHVAASTLAGLVATTLCNPFDVLKTRIMAKNERLGMVEMIRLVHKIEGPTWMFRGWLPAFIRLGPHTVATFLFLEQHKKYYRKHYAE